jgi:hypothetical protein
MSKEYIEREAVVVFLENMAASQYLIQCFEDKGHFPAADVEPVRHGKWIEDLYAEKCGDAYCSECNHFDWSNLKYCSNCGAKMDGGKK